MEEMTRGEVHEVLSRSRLGVLSLARGNHAYAFPLFFGFTGKAFYFHSHPGEKDRYIEATEEACLVVVEAASEDEWQSVMAFGHVHPVRFQDELREAMDVLLAIPPPPELGTTDLGEPKRSMEDANYWRLAPVRLAGRKSARPPAGYQGIE